MTKDLPGTSSAIDRTGDPSSRLSSLSIATFRAPSRSSQSSLSRTAREEREGEGEGEERKDEGHTNAQGDVEETEDDALEKAEDSYTAAGSNITTYRPMDGEAQLSRLVDMSSSLQEERDGVVPRLPSCARLMKELARRPRVSVSFLVNLQ